jgi:hypothetical protein
LVTKPPKKIPLERLRYRWEYNAKIDLKEIDWEGVWTGFVWLRVGRALVNMVMSFQVS